MATLRDPSSEISVDIIAFSFTNRSIAEVVDPASQLHGLSRGHHNPGAGVVDKDGRVPAVNLVVVLRDGVVRASNTTYNERNNRKNRIMIIMALYFIVVFPLG